MGRYDIISPSEIFGMKGRHQSVSREARVETYHDGKSNRSDKSITEKKTNGTCVE
jgi:hypothetical protein